MIGTRKFRTRQARKRENVRVAIISVLSAVGIFTVGALTVWALGTEPMRIKTVVVENDGAIQTDAIQATVAQAFEKTHAFFIPNDSVLFSGMNIVKKELHERFPRIEHVDLERVGVRTLLVAVQERTPRALWCGDIVPDIAYRSSHEQQTAGEEAWGACYLVDGTGFLYARAPIYTGDIFMRYYGSLDNASPIGQYFLSSEEFLRWETFLEDLKEDGLLARALLIVDERDGELYLDNGLRILIPRTEDLDTLRNRLFATVEEQAIDTSRNIEYIDLRFGTKAFVRYVEIPDEALE